MLYRLGKPLLFCLDPEKAHHLAMWGARKGGEWLGKRLRGTVPDGKPVEVAGLNFKNPIGLAAGFDKNGVALPFWRGVGFGHIEIGTVTPRAQPGNPPPRMWRFKDLRALGNKLGFPNDGAALVASRIRVDKEKGDVVGINLGKNKETPNERAADDYLAALDATRNVADYWVVNVSSPNTPGLRELQSRQYLTDLLGKVREASGDVPLFVKLSPDLDEEGLQDAAVATKDARCAGVVATNTTLERPEGIAFEGGLSGAPLAGRSIEVLRELRRLLPELPLISVGGVDSTDEVRARMEAGASLVQIYSALVFEGPGLVGRILRELG
ncbi:MAG: quinone-dependent dihydroorotate dehydrogenase [Planctomycetota bacterium]|jgi:dihydroorotate dehydrogenase